MATTPDAAVRALSHRGGEAAAPVALDSAVVHPGYAGLVTRAIAAAIDALLINLTALAVAAVVALVLSIFPVAQGTETVLAVIGGVLFVLWVGAYFVTFWSTTGQTPGDRVMHVAVVRVGGGLVRPWRALLRLLGAVAGLVLFLGYVSILLTARRRAFHDWLAGTVVVNRAASPPPPRT
jgi:uncharacterized RDD family membrane protein YckC